MIYLFTFIYRIINTFISLEKVAEIPLHETSKATKTTKNVIMNYNEHPIYRDSDAAACQPPTTHGYLNPSSCLRDLGHYFLWANNSVSEAVLVMLMLFSFPQGLMCHRRLIVNKQNEIELQSLQQRRHSPFLVITNVTLILIMTFECLLSPRKVLNVFCNYIIES